MAQPILECDGLSRYFGALAAVNGLSFTVQPGTVFGIAGPNGAGKTTLFNLLSGHVPVSSGSVMFDGATIQGLAPHRICQKGLARTFQIPLAFGSATVEENALVGGYFGSRARVAGIRFDSESKERARSALALVGLDGKGGVPAHLLSVFDKKRLMIASALASSPKLLLLDEPVGGLNHAEIDQFIELIGTLSATGLTIVLIEHVMRALMSLSDRVMILHHGEKLAEGTPTEIRSNPEVIHIYLGREAKVA